MLNELIDRYTQYSDVELMDVYLNKNSYTDDAKKALEIVVENKGGVQSLNNRYNKIVEREIEKSRISNEVIKFYEKRNDKK